MPTGYTAGVQTGKIIELKDYILDCSRGFGALIHMRDDNNSSTVKHREVSDYHLKQLEKVQKDFEEFKNTTDEQIQQKLNENYNQCLKDKDEGLKRFEEGKQRYLDMLNKVKLWEPPTTEHFNLKNFAIKQLEDSLSFDYSDNMKDYYLEIPLKEDLDSYKSYKIKSYLKDIKYHAESYKQEIENVEEANKWIDDLIDSLK